MSKQLCATLWEGFNNVIEARAALQTLLEKSDSEGFDTEQLKSAIAALQNNNAEYQQLLKTSATLPDGTPIHATDYLALCKLAADNDLDRDKVLERITCDCISFEGRVLTTSLTNLGLSNISALKHLTALTKLWLDNNQIINISPLKNLTSLTNLWLENNQIINISPLKNLTGLTSLWLQNNQIIDISPIQKLNALTSLLLSDNQIEDISPIKDLPIFNSYNFISRNNPFSEDSKALLEARRIS